MKEGITFEQSVASAMDFGGQIEIIEFLPYIFQDIWELGTNPETIIQIIKNHFEYNSTLKLLDLGCGKGAVSIKAASELNCCVTGIDGVKGFVEFAAHKGKEYNVETLCNFIFGDIREEIQKLDKFDVIILGAVGPIFGDYIQTLSVLKEHLSNKGIIIIDDGYIDNESDFTHKSYLKKDILFGQIEQAGFAVSEYSISEEKEVEEMNDDMFSNIENRCNELIQKYPGRKDLFINYMKSQEEEGNINANLIKCGVFVLKAKLCLI